MSLFTERLNHLRNERRVTQLNISKEIDVSPQTLSNYFNGREPDFDTLCRLAGFFGVSTDYLLGITDYQTPQEEFSMKSAEIDNSSVAAVSLYRTFCLCSDDIRNLYNEKMPIGKQIPELMLILHENLNYTIRTIQEITEEIFNYRDSSDRDTIVKKTILELGNTKFIEAVLTEALRISDEK